MWGMAHAGAGQISIPDVFMYILALLRLHDEEGPSLAWEYHLQLVAQATARIKSEERFPIGKLLRELQGDIVSSLRVLHESAGLPVDKNRTRGGPRSGKEREHEVRVIRPPLCFANDARKGKTCNDKNCRATKDHVDTDTAEGATRFDSAFKAAAAGTRHRLSGIANGHIVQSS